MRYSLMIVFVGALLTPVVTYAQNTCCDCTLAETQEKQCLTIKPEKLTDRTDCRTLPENAKLPPGWTCVKEPLSDTKCKTVPDKGICPGPPFEAFALSGAVEVAKPSAGDAAQSASQAQKAAEASPIIPVLNIPIPGLKFDPENPGSFIGTYVSGAYRYAISIVAIAATIAFIYGAFLYLVGASIDNIAKGKQIMMDAVVGMLLVLSATTILRIFNPATTEFRPLQIISINPRDAFADVALERARTESYARLSGLIEVPVIDLGTGEVSVPAPVGAATAGTLAKDESGNLIASKQKGCPPDMLAIKNSPSYPKGNVPSFCMDRYEAPNSTAEGVKPFNAVTEFEAEWFCKSISKRLCTVDEFVRACLGPDGKNTFGYGPKFIPGLYTKGAAVPHPSAPGAYKYTLKSGGTKPGPCNYDSPTKVGSGFIQGAFSNLYTTKAEESTLENPNNPKFSDAKYKASYDKLKATIAKLQQNVEPSGFRKDAKGEPSCMTPEGVIDLTGNVQEITVSQSGAALSLEERIKVGDDHRQKKLSSKTPPTKPYSWRSFFWDPNYHLAYADPKPTCEISGGGVHEVGFRAHENGFRCCMNLAD